MADTKISAATNTTTPVSTDMIPFARSADTTPRKITVANLLAPTAATVAALDTRIDDLETTAAVVTVEEVDATPSLSASTLVVPNGSLTDLENGIVQYTPYFLALTGLGFSSFAGLGGRVLQVKSDATVVEAVSTYDLVSLSGTQLVVAEDAGNSRVTLTSHPPAPNTISWNHSATNNTASNATNEWPSSQRRHKTDLTYATQARLVVRVVTAFPTGATLTAQYSTDDSTFDELDGASGPSCLLTSANTTVVSSWVNLAAAAKADVFLRMLISGGADATVSQTIGTIELQFR